MAALDRRATAEFGIQVAQLMENAGRVAADHIGEFIEKELERPLSNAKVFVCCGRGNKAGDGLVAARYLKEKGCRVFFEIAPPKAGSSYGQELLDNLKRAMAAGVSGRQMGEDKVPLGERLATADLLIDAVLGTGSKGNPREEAELMIRAMNGCKKPVIAIDLPSGLDPDSGAPGEPCIKAVLTLTLALPKKGLLASAAKPFVGELKVLDIGFPKALSA